jgi:hypothetical protein
MHATLPTHLIFLDFITLIIMGHKLINLSFLVCVYNNGSVLSLEYFHWILSIAWLKLSSVSGADSIS